MEDEDEEESLPLGDNVKVPLFMDVSVRTMSDLSVATNEQGPLYGLYTSMKQLPGFSQGDSLTLAGYTGLFPFCQRVVAWEVSHAILISRVRGTEHKVAPTSDARRIFTPG